MNSFASAPGHRGPTIGPGQRGSVTEGHFLVTGTYQQGFVALYMYVGLSKSFIDDISL